MAQTKTQGDVALVGTLTGISPDYARTLWRFTATLPPETHLHLIRRKRDLFRQKGRPWCENHPHREQEIELACLLMAMRELYLADKSLKHKDKRNREAILEADRMISEMRLGRESKGKGDGKKEEETSPLRKMVIQYAQVISGLRGKGRSWRKIAAYLQKHTGKKISHVYLQRCMQESVGDTSPADMENAADALPEKNEPSPEPQPPK